MGKKRKNVPTLQEILDRPICYYCEKDFEHLGYLIDHMKAKHFRCENCGRRLQTIGGLSVHMSQVHKEKLEKVSNALEDRDNPNVEIFGMEGWPKDLLDNHKARVTNEYFKRETEHRKQTGNPPPGTKTAPNPQKNESIEDTKKRFAEFKAKKLAAKAAAANGDGSAPNTPPVAADEGSGVNAGQEDASAPIKQESKSPNNTTNAHWDPPKNINLPSGGWGVVRGFDVNPYSPSSSAYDEKPGFPPSRHTPPPSALPQYPTSSMSAMSMYPTSSMSIPPNIAPPPPDFVGGHKFTNPGKAGLGYKPPTPSYSGPPAGTAFNTGLAGSPLGPPSLPQFDGSLPLPPPDPGSGGPPVSVPRQNSLPSAPGLPQRPAFDSPNISKEDMAKMHGGPSLPSVQPNHYNGGPMPPGPYGMSGQPFNAPHASYGATNPPYGASYGASGSQYGMPPAANGMPPGPWYPPNQGNAASQPPSSYIGDQVDELIQEITSEKEKSSAVLVNQEPERSQTPEPVPKSKLDPHLSKDKFSGEQEVESMQRSVLTNDPLQENTGSNYADGSGTATAKKSGTKRSSHTSKEKSKLLWTDSTLSPEEKRARKYTSRMNHSSSRSMRKFSTSSRTSSRTKTVIDQPGEEGQRVTGPVDDSLND